MGRTGDGWLAWETADRLFPLQPRLRQISFSCLLSTNTPCHNLDIPLRKGLKNISQPCSQKNLQTKYSEAFISSGWHWQATVRCVSTLTMLEIGCLFRCTHKMSSMIIHNGSSTNPLKMNAVDRRLSRTALQQVPRRFRATLEDKSS